MAELETMGSDDISLKDSPEDCEKFDFNLCDKRACFLLISSFSSPSFDPGYRECSDVDGKEHKSCRKSSSNSSESEYKEHSEKSDSYV